MPYAENTTVSTDKSRAEIERTLQRYGASSSNGSCERCGECGSAETYANQVMMPLQGKVRSIDWCIHQIVAALNAGGVETVACCCGHGAEQGRIDLADGRILRVETPS